MLVSLETHLLLEKKILGYGKPGHGKSSEEIQKLSKGLIKLGVQEGDHVAVIGRNRPSLYWSLLACQHIGAIPVPLYQDAVAEETSTFFPTVVLRLQSSEIRAGR